MSEELIMKIPACRTSIRGALIAIALIVCLPAQPLAAQTTAQEPGSSRTARIAFPMESGPVELTYLARSMEPEDLAQLRRVAPNVRVVTGLSPEEALKLAPQVHGIDGRYCSSEFLRAADKLCWVQSTSAGVERYMAVAELRDNERVVLTNMRAVHGPTIADHAFAMLLALTRDLPYYLDPAQDGTWNRRGSGAKTIALQDKTLVVVGLGGIGSEVARRGKGFGMHVLATRRSDTPPPPYVDRQARPDALMELLPEADVVVLCVPLTTQTEGMIGADEFEAFKPDSYLVNIARGKVVDTDALVKALEEGRLAGACLDVTDPEPLPPGHPLWTMPNVVITPHMSGRSALTEERWRTVYLENLRRFGAGEPLLNVVDKNAGY
jgi:phosphoglycerate dehydrogenase-like enzyme